MRRRSARPAESAIRAARQGAANGRPVTTAGVPAGGSSPPCRPRRSRAGRSRGRWRGRGVGEKAALVMLPTSRPSPASGEPAWWNEGAIDHQACEPPCNAAVPAVQDPDDDLLSDVAALCHADRAALDAGFERDRAHSSCRRRSEACRPLSAAPRAAIAPERLRTGAKQVARQRLAGRRGAEGIHGRNAEDPRGRSAPGAPRRGRRPGTHAAGWASRLRLRR